MTDDVSQGWVWLGGLKLPHRSVVKLRAADTGKSVYCEVLSIDDNFIDNYNDPDAKRFKIKDKNQSVLVAAEWYRTRLGIEKTGDEVDIEVITDIPFRGLWAALDHPQVVVRIATKLGIWSVILAAAALCFAVAPFFKKCP